VSKHISNCTLPVDRLPVNYCKRENGKKVSGMWNARLLPRAGLNFKRRCAIRHRMGRDSILAKIRGKIGGQAGRRRETRRVIARSAAISPSPCRPARENASRVAGDDPSRREPARRRSVAARARQAKETRTAKAVGVVGACEGGTAARLDLFRRRVLYTLRPGQPAGALKHIGRSNGFFAPFIFANRIDVRLRNGLGVCLPAL